MRSISMDCSLLCQVFAVLACRFAGLLSRLLMCMSLFYLLVVFNSVYVSRILTILLCCYPIYTYLLECLSGIVAQPNRVTRMPKRYKTAIGWHYATTYESLELDTFAETDSKRCHYDRLTFLQIPPLLRKNVVRSCWSLKGNCITY